MELIGGAPLLAALWGAALGAIGCLLVVRSRYAAQLAAATTERDLLRARVAETDAALQQARELAFDEADRALDAVQLVAPLRESLRRVETQVQALERDRGEQFARVALELTRVQSSTDGLREQTASLVGSLSSANVRGSWGEVSLQRVLEASGMLARCDFDTQVTIRASTEPGGAGWEGGPRGAPAATASESLAAMARSGARAGAGARAAPGLAGARRPDVVVRLPGDKHLAIDAKAPMSHFLAAQADGLTAAERTGELRRHAAALRGHVDALAGKGYWAGLPSSPELVVCFVPGEGLLAAALAADPALHEHALSRGITLASPATLLALLRTVAMAWRHDSLTRGARELLVLGRELYGRIGAVGRHTEALGESLSRSVGAYNALVGSVESRLLVTARRMEQLGLGDAGAAAGQVGAATDDGLPRVEPPRLARAPELSAAFDERGGRPTLDDPLLR